MREALLPLTITLSVPVPLMVKLVRIGISPLVSVMVWES
jgi:hypothetical protein